MFNISSLTLVYLSCVGRSLLPPRAALATTHLAEKARYGNLLSFLPPLTVTSRLYSDTFRISSRERDQDSTRVRATDYLAFHFPQLHEYSSLIASLCRPTPPLSEISRKLCPLLRSLCHLLTGTRLRPHSTGTYLPLACEPELICIQCRCTGRRFSQRCHRDRLSTHQILRPEGFPRALLRLLSQSIEWYLERS